MLIGRVSPAGTPELEAIMRYASIASVAAAAILAATAAAQTAREVRGPAPSVPLAGQPSARIIVDPPLAE